MNEVLARVLKWLQSAPEFENPELQEDNTILVSYEDGYYAIKVETF